MGNFITALRDRISTRSRSRSGSRSRSRRPEEDAKAPKPSQKRNHSDLGPKQAPEQKGPVKASPAVTKVHKDESLWDQAYDELRNDNGKRDTIEAYEAILLAESQTDPTPINTASKIEREIQMTALVQKKMGIMDEKQWRLKLCGGEVGLREQADRVVKVVLLVKDFASSAASQAPLGAGLPLAGVCVLLSLFVNDTAQQTAAIDGFDYVSTLIRRFSQIERIYINNGNYKDTEDLEVSMKKLYKKVLEYEATAACYFDKNTVRRAGRNILRADSWKDLLGQIKEQESVCDGFKQQIDSNDQLSRAKCLQKSLDEHVVRIEEQLKSRRQQDEVFRDELRKIRTTFRAEFETQAKNDCFRSLRTTTYEDTMEKNPDRVPGTCEWFLKHQKYREWLANSESDVLWVTADPGCGKSVLSRYLVKDYIDWVSSDTSICYFFFKDNSNENKSSSHAMCAILHQLFRQRKHLIGHAVDEFKSNNSKIPIHFGTLWRILLQAAADNDAGTIICVIDALDESDEASCETLVEHLAEFYKNKSSNSATKIKFLITSRPTQPLHIKFFKGFWSGKLAIQLAGENEEETDEISKEINLVIDKKAEDFKRLREYRFGVLDDAHELLKDRLKAAQNRTYLWLSLVYPEIEKKAGWAKEIVQKSINELPRSLDDAYEKILENSSRKEEARVILHIICGAFRPFSLDQMNHALSHAMKRELQPVSSFPGIIRDICGLFINIQNNKVYLIHQTAKEFLVGGGGGVHYGWKGSFHAANSNAVLANACIRYLHSTSTDFEFIVHDLKAQDKWWKRLNDSPLFEYAAKFWRDHFNTGIPDQLQVGEVIQLCQPFSFWHVMWRYTHNVRVASRCELSSMHIASCLGLEPVVSQLLLGGIEDTGKCTALQHAAINGHQDVVHLLLKSGVDVDATYRDPDSSYFKATALYMAANKGHQDIVHLLLKFKADPNIRNDDDDSPLSYAAKFGYKDIVHLLLKFKADPNIRDHDGDSPLSPAATFGYKDIVRLLLEYGADANNRNLWHQSALFIAAQEGEQDVVSLLLEYGANVNNTDLLHQSALLTAAKWGHQDVVSLLLESGANVEGDDTDPDDDIDSVSTYRSRVNSKTPLMIAARYGHLRVVEILLKAKANIEAKNSKGRNALFYADKGEHFAVSRLLLDSGAGPSTAIYPHTESSSSSSSHDG